MCLKKKFPPENIVELRRKALQWASGYRQFCYLNGNALPYLHGSFPVVLAVGNEPPFMSLTEAQERRNWVFGYMGYAWADAVYHQPLLGFGQSEWFVPEIRITFLTDGSLSVESDIDPDEVFSQIEAQSLRDDKSDAVCALKAVHSKTGYVDAVNELKAHLLRGNVYQVNFCTSFEAENEEIDPVSVYEQLNQISPMPFSGLLKMGEKFVITASPERYLKKVGSQIVSQPIKGTAPRGIDHQSESQNIGGLLSSEKERAENVMIVDLVRNDLSRVCVPGTVEVEMLCELKTFQTVHQLVSTVVGEVEPDASVEAIMKATFPMGSMTGAPKIKAMQLLDSFELRPRSIFSGAIGYFSPEGDFDFNVLIRSIFYNQQQKRLSYSVGSGITVLSDAEKEYEECMLKAQSIRKVLGIEY
jgi:para-aminobenzoate synthetase component I